MSLINVSAFLEARSSALCRALATPYIQKCARGATPLRRRRKTSSPFPRCRKGHKKARDSKVKHLLATHRWHRKRFHMGKVLGYTVPMTSNEKQRRKMHRALFHGVALHDATYRYTVDLTGPLLGGGGGLSRSTGEEEDEERSEGPVTGGGKGKAFCPMLLEGLPGLMVTPRRTQGAHSACAVFELLGRRAAECVVAPQKSFPKSFPSWRRVQFDSERTICLFIDYRRALVVCHTADAVKVFTSLRRCVDRRQGVVLGVEDRREASLELGGLWPLHPKDRRATVFLTAVKRGTVQAGDAVYGSSSGEDKVGVVTWGGYSMRHCKSVAMAKVPIESLEATLFVHGHAYTTRKLGKDGEVPR